MRPVGTVGAVALDVQGNLAAGTSTGGTYQRLAGRVGDTPIIGAGTYADNRVGAVSGTGALHLIGGPLKLTGTNNTYTGGTIVETGSTLLLTTNNVSTGNASVTFIQHSPVR